MKSRMSNWLTSGLLLVSLTAVGGPFEEGISALRNQDNAAAAKNFSQAAQAGHLDAQFNLGYLLANGMGVARDDTLATQWYRKAAEAGHPGAQSNLAFMIAAGRGAKQDDAEAVAWYQKAAEQGDAAAQVSLGLRYLNGRGVVKDRSKAVYWLQLAGMQGHPTAKQAMREIYAGEVAPAKQEDAMTGMVGMSGGSK